MKSQSALPVDVFLPVADNGEVHFSAAFSRSCLDGGDGGFSVATLSSPTIKAYRSFCRDRLFGSLGLVLPLGKTKLDSTQLVLAQLLAGDYLNLPIKQLGGGFGVLMQFGGAEQYEQFIYGGSVSYYYAGTYTFAAGSKEYDPGDEITLQGSATAPLGAGRIDLDLGYKYYYTDKLGPIEILKNGDQFSLSLRGSYDLAPTNASLGLLYITRARNSRPQGEVFNYEENNSYGAKLVFSGAVSHLVKPDWKATALFAYRALGANDWKTDHPAYFGSSNLFSIGADLTFSGNRGRYSLFGRILFSFGSADDDAISISGNEISVGGRVKL